MCTGGGIDHPVAVVKASGTYYFQQDALGNVTALTDASGTLVEQYSYDVYGQPTIRDGSGTLKATALTPFLFTGREYDAETGLYHYRSQAYSPTLGRFLQPDSIDFSGGDVNIYRYVRNNAVNVIDPSGFKPGQLYPTRDDAAKAAMGDIFAKSMSDHKEMAGELLYDPDHGKFTYSDPREGNETHSEINPHCFHYEGYYHSHPQIPGYDPDHFSPADISTADHSGKPGYVITPSGNMMRYDLDPGMNGSGHVSNINK